MNPIQTISFIGSGNVATHLAKAFYDNGISVRQIVSRTEKNARILANEVKAEPRTDIAQLEPVDCIILAISDDAISAISEQLQEKHTNTLVVHTSGIRGIYKTGRSGYFYPLQSFKKSLTTDVKKTPFFIKASSKKDTASLLQLGRQISENVHEIDNHAKQRLHLSAVIVNNFVNHLFGITN